MTACRWCNDGVCRSGDETTCDFKTLPYDKDAIKKRIDDEMDTIESKLKQMESENDPRLLKAMSGDCADRIMGIQVMVSVLKDEFGASYKSERNPFRFMILVKRINKHLKKVGGVK